MKVNKQNENLEEEIEGLEEATGMAWGDYPIDTVLVRDERRTVHDILRRIEQGRFIMNPDFQRDFIWNVEKQSRLIESVLMRIPLPVFYLAENEAGKLVVVDGLQRLSTFRAFHRNELKLKLPNNKELHGKKFNDLVPKLKNRIEDCNLILYILDHKVPERARLDMFERVNGGVPLSRQQMRNCMYMGEATKFIREESKTEIFKKASGGSLSSLNMRDREFVNRFCAFQILPLEQYKGDIDGFLADALREMNRYDPKKLNELGAQFRNSMENNFQVFGKHAFRKHVAGQERLSVPNASLWDIMSTGLSRYPTSLVKSRTDTLRIRFYELMSDEQFMNAISHSTGNVPQVRTRFTKAKAMFEEVLGAHTD